MGLMLPRFVSGGTRVLEILYEVGAFSYSLIIGLIAALTIALDTPHEVQLLMVSNAIGYGVAISARNAGRPAIAIGQMFLSLCPICIASSAIANAMASAPPVILLQRTATVVERPITLVRIAVTQPRAAFQSRGPPGFLT